ncbi:MAG: hypothetical protein LQ343_006380 [Gyalolechia ehrenbergii]|nr:MAG: hypothetical protein LQ343_006380 [Gyalolechia ehrenbergii]
MALNPAMAVERSVSASPPTTRDSSPSPSISPTPALSACPPLDRSVSATSSTAASTASGHSIGSRSSSASAAPRQRGYVRPQGVTFADSAGKRDSVLSLGSIAHLQYYFARTGLLDGKGAQLAKDQKPKRGVSDSHLESKPKIRPTSGTVSFDDVATESPAANEVDSLEWDRDNTLPPPTVSTYRHKVQYLPPPPDSSKLRRDLKKTLRDAEKVLQGVVSENSDGLDRRKRTQAVTDLGEAFEDKEPSPLKRSHTAGWYEIQGLQILDVVTLAIRAAKMYYTAHEQPQRIYSIKSERQIREELVGVLDVLKRMASRNFAGGLKEEELTTIKDWLQGVGNLINDEQALEKQESKEQEKWQWLEGAWEGREREQEWSFLNSFLSEGRLPDWTPLDSAASLPTPFLESLRNGLNLVHLHNAMLKKSKRQFGEIKTFHTDTAKPYRCAENLRFWIKAVEIRWELKVKVDVTGIVHKKEAAWPGFDAAILGWCKTAREGLTEEWKESTKMKRSSTFFSAYPEPESAIQES